VHAAEGAIAAADRCSPLTNCALPLRGLRSSLLSARPGSGFRWIGTETADLGRAKRGTGPKRGRAAERPCRFPASSSQRSHCRLSRLNLLLVSRLCSPASRAHTAGGQTRIRVSGDGREDGWYSARGLRAQAYVAWRACRPICGPRVGLCSRASPARSRYEALSGAARNGGGDEAVGPGIASRVTAPRNAPPVPVLVRRKAIALR
jgi:hypothetical protein